MVGQCKCSLDRHGGQEPAPGLNGGRLAKTPHPVKGTML
jgi:hypothetical protein